MKSSNILQIKSLGKTSTYTYLCNSPLHPHAQLSIRQQLSSLLVGEVHHRRRCGRRGMLASGDSSALVDAISHGQLHHLSQEDIAGRLALLLRIPFRDRQDLASRSIRTLPSHELRDKSAYFFYFYIFFDSKKFIFLSNAGSLQTRSGGIRFVHLST